MLYITPSTLPIYLLQYIYLILYQILSGYLLSQNNEHIEAFFNALDFSWQDLIEFMPIGIIFFDNNWEIKSVNRNLTDFFEGEWLNIKLEGSNLFVKNSFTENLPINEILFLKEGKNFETVVSFENKYNDRIKLRIQGSPIFKDGIFKGGSLAIENYNTENTNIEDLDFTSNTFISFLKKICKCFLIINQDGIIKYASSSEKHKCEFLKDKIDLDIFSLYEERYRKSIESTISNVLRDKKQNSIELEYFSENKKLIFNNYFVPLHDKNKKVKAIIVFLREQTNNQEDGVSYLSNSENFKNYYEFALFNSDALFKVNLRGKITYWADNAINLFKLSNDVVLNKFLGDFFPQVNQNYFDRIREELLINNQWEDSIEFSYGKTDATVKAKFILVRDGINTDILVYCNKVDSQQQKIISAKEEERGFFRDTVLKSDEMILQVNPNGTILFANEKFCTEFEYELDEIRGVNFSDIIENNFKLQNKITDFFRSIHKGVYEIIPLLSKSGQIIEVCPNVNISTIAAELKYFTIYLRKCNKEEKLFLDTAHALLYRSAEALMIVYNNRIVKVNPKLLALLGSEYETDYYNKNSIKIISVESQEIFTSFLMNSGISQLEESIQFIKNDSATFEADVKKIYSSPDSLYSVISISPLADKQVESNEKLSYVRKFATYLNEYFWSASIKENQIKINFISPEIYEAFGYTHVDFITQINFWQEIIHPDDFEAITSSINTLLPNTNIVSKELTYRIITKANEVVWINNNLKIVRDEQGNATEVIGSIRDVTESAQEREALRGKIKELEKLNTTKDKFISIISHDLKSPFTSIVGFSDLILSDMSLEKEDMREYVSNIKDASMHTVGLLNGLLDWTRLQTGRMEIAPTIISAHYIANKTVELLAGIAFQKGLNISAHVDDSIYINVDENLIFQVFNNLVANSIKFTPKGGKIDIYATVLEDKQKVQFIVKDTGVGIEEGDIAKLFVVDKKFTNLGTEGERGTGLGLSLVSEIIQKHNGEISVRSEINKGSEFIFTLPISSPSILLIDTMQSERILYSKLIESITSGISIYQSESIEDSILTIKEKKPMLIVCEHSLDKSSGLRFMEFLSKSELDYKPSLFIIARNLKDEELRLYNEKGIEDVFTKPIDLKLFKSKLDEVIGMTN